VQAVDTNILARFILKDDIEQYAMARAILERDIFVPITVLIELSWVLSVRYRLSRAVVHTALAGLIDLANVSIVDGSLVRWAMGRFAEGADLTDMLHLVMGRDATRFVTFDQGIARDAGPEAPVVIETLGVA
jgi:predicted nucleic-acid-binding protein